MRIAACIWSILLISTAMDTPTAQYEKLRIQLSIDSGKRHLSYGNSLEDKWIYPLAVKQFRLAMEQSVGQLSWHATKAYNAMKNLSPAFIARHYRFPNSKELKAYRTKARAEHNRDRKGWKRLADFAATHPEALLSEALSGYKRLISDRGEVLEFDEDERIVLPEGAIRANLARVLAESEGTVTLNGKTYLCNEFFRCISSIHEKDVKDLEMVKSEILRIYCQKKLEDAEELLALGEALYNILKKDFKDSPDRTLDIFLFEDRALYEAYCRASDHVSYTHFDAFTHLKHFTSVICLVRKGGERLETEELHSLILHELVHLFLYGMTRTTMPEWYEEGMAETYGGFGTFDWKDGRLKVKGKLHSSRISILHPPGNHIDMDMFLNAKISTHMGDDDRFMQRFYAQSWAFLSHLRDHAGFTVKNKLHAWEIECFSQNLSREEARDLFRKKFINEIPKLEQSFQKYLGKLNLATH